MLQVKLKGNPEKILQELKRQFPKATEKAMVTGAMVIRKVARESLAGRGIVNLPPIAQETKTIRKARGKAGRKLGGVLFTYMKSFATNGKVYSGWPDGLKQLGEMFQTSETRKRETWERQMLHRAYGLEHPSTTYSRPARQLWEPLANSQTVFSRVVDAIVKRLKAMADKATRGTR
jgi:hypothetical protein